MAGFGQHSAQRFGAGDKRADLTASLNLTVSLKTPATKKMGSRGWTKIARRQA
jgi:hypothetical protein